MTVPSITAPKEVNIDAAIAGMALKADNGKNVLALRPTGFGKSLKDRWLIQSAARYVLKEPALF